MKLTIFGHPFSSYTQKALIALYENELPFDFKIIGPEAPENFDRLKQAWPLAKFPLHNEARPYRRYFPLGAPDRD